MRKNNKFHILGEEYRLRLEKKINHQYLKKLED